MSTNEFGEEVIEKVEDVQQEIDDKSSDDSIDWKAKAEEYEGRLRRAETKLSKVSEKAPSKSGELDYGQKAFLVANGIKGNDEIQKVRDIMSNTGKSLDEVLESKYFQAELKEMRELKATAEAIPQGSKRGTQSAQSTVEYWIAKGELPPVSDRELRQQVVNARIKKESKGGAFYNS